ncbi:hypothetical protein [Thalassobaculum sp.]|uniref:hypothetical protein n=1 Tax=Thalassobaculum sp. TaxID=2022740 RepID=UPI0032EF5BB3
MRRAAAPIPLLLLLVAGGPAAAASLDGIWGVAQGDAVNCSGTNVVVLRDGHYTKAQLDLGTTKGLRDVVIGTAAYSFDGVRLVVAPSLSLSRPEPRQVFDWDPVGQVLVRVEPAPRLTYRRCPDRPLRPLDD